MRTTLKTRRSILVLGLLCFSTQVLHAQTPSTARPAVAATIWIEPRASTDDRSGIAPREILQSDVLIDKFDDQAIVYHKLNDKAPTSIAESRVVWIAPQGLDKPISNAIDSLYEHRAEIDSASLLKELKQPHPAWLSQWIGMHLWQATYLGEKSAATLELINQLDAQPMPSMMVGGLPIRWSEDKLSAIALSAAKDYLSDKREATMLTAASWLLDSESDEQARAVLNRLATETKRKPIRALAGLLLQIQWDSTSAKQLAPQTLQAFDQLPLTLSAGPTQRLGAWYRHKGQSDRAVEMLLRSILNAPRPNPLSSLPPESEELWKGLQAGMPVEK